MIEINNNTWIMPSHLDASVVPIILKKYTKQVPCDKNWNIDFSRCKKIDSAGLAIIIGFIKQAKNIELRLHHLSDEAISLAKAHGVEEIISKYLALNQTTNTTF